VPADQILRDKVSASLRAGTLPRIDHHAWAGKALGDHTCACCGMVIERDAAEHEPRAAPGLFAHVACFGAWYAESERLEQAGGDPSSGATAAGA
jgi:hypothetical protein